MSRSVHIGIIGDFDPEFRPHSATDEALIHAARHLQIPLEIEWLPTRPLETETSRSICRFDGLWCAPGSPYRSLAGALAAIRLARLDGTPVLGTCGGFQHVVIEYARNVLGYQDAQHAEYDPYSSSLFISELTCSLAGQALLVHIRPETLARRLYGDSEAEEQYYCNFGLDPESQALLEQGGMVISGTDPDGEARILELPDHPFFLATLFVPQLRSTEDRPHPLILGLVHASAAACAVGEVGSVASSSSEAVQREPARLEPASSD